LKDFVDYAKIKRRPFNTLQLLNLNGNLIGDTGAIILATALQYMPELTTLALNLNKIGDEGAAALATQLPKKLTHLDLSYNEIRDAGTIAVINVLPKLYSLKTLNFSANPVGRGGTDALARVVTWPPMSFENLYLSDIEMYQDGKLALINNLQKLTKLKTLELSNLAIATTTIPRLATTLRHLTVLEKLNLSKNYINDDMTSLRDILASMNTLKSLDLSDNDINDESAILLAEALPSMVALKMLYLEKNPISEVGIRALEDALQKNPNINIQLKGRIINAKAAAGAAAGAAAAGAGAKARKSRKNRR
jgi:Ran GTPase-activating protein (RanGAP) involved in mRNA processing and transport